VTDLRTSRPGAVEPGSLEVIRQAREHEEMIRASKRLDRPNAEWEENQSPPGRQATALEHIARSLARIADALERRPSTT
jgi:hypothetical protein